MSLHEPSIPRTPRVCILCALRYAVMLVLLVCSATPVLAGAEGSGFTEIVPAPTVVIEQRGKRRTELRQALTGSVELPQGAAERERLSRDQREALNRELRETLRGVYDERAGGPR